MTRRAGCPRRSPRPRRRPGPRPRGSVVPVAVAWIADPALADLDVRGRSARESRTGGSSVPPGGQGVECRGSGRGAVPCWVVVDAACCCRSEPAGHALAAASLRPPNGSPPPKNGMLERSTSMLIAPSRVAARTMLTSQVLSDWPASAARSSALALTDSGMRSVIRERLPSSTSSGAGGGGGAGGRRRRRRGRGSRGRDR